MEEFVDEIEQDPALRKNFLLFKNEDVDVNALQLDEEMVQLKELVQELDIREKDDIETLDPEQFTKMKF